MENVSEAEALEVITDIEAAAQASNDLFAATMELAVTQFRTATLKAFVEYRNRQAEIIAMTTAAKQLMGL